MLLPAIRTGSEEESPSAMGPWFMANRSAIRPSSA
jgi:hypothetical protein